MLKGRKMAESTVDDKVEKEMEAIYEAYRNVLRNRWAALMAKYIDNIQQLKEENEQLRKELEELKRKS